MRYHELCEEAEAFIEAERPTIEDLETLMVTQERVIVSTEDTDRNLHSVFSLV
jgi:hypothetical protein